jgi:hypothetical protein
MRINFPMEVTKKIYTQKEIRIKSGKLNKKYIKEDINGVNLRENGIR